MTLLAHDLTADTILVLTTRSPQFMWSHRIQSVCVVTLFLCFYYISPSLSPGASSQVVPLGQISRLPDAGATTNEDRGAVEAAGIGPLAASTAQGPWARRRVR